MWPLFTPKFSLSLSAPAFACLGSFSRCDAQLLFSHFGNLFKRRLFVCNTQQWCRRGANTGRHSKLHTKCLQSSRRRFKMADSRKPVCVCVCVWERRRVFPVDWDVGSIPMTDPYRRQIKTAVFWWGSRRRLHQDPPRPPSRASASRLSKNPPLFYLKLILGFDYI